MDPATYDYNVAGFDGFLSRSIDSNYQTNLNAAGPQSTAMAFDRSQPSGSIGGTFRVGKISIDGVKGRISIYDDAGNEVGRIGELDD